MDHHRYKDRSEAGRLLAERLKGTEDAVVLAMPRGGVPVAAEIAKALTAPLDLVIARKLGHPRNREYAIGAVTEDGEALLNEAECARIDPTWLQRAVERAAREARRRRERYLGRQQPVPVEGRTAIVVDDGIATGFTMRAALRSVRKRGPKLLIVAVPVAPTATVESLRQEADAVVSLLVENRLYGIGAYYEDFSPVSDRQVVETMRAARPSSEEKGRARA